MHIFKDAFLPKHVDMMRSQVVACRSWTSLISKWHPNLLRGIEGSMDSAVVPIQIESVIRTALTSLYPGYRKDPLHIAFQRYGIGGGVAPHIDENTTFAATIFLNTDWELSHGGLYIYRDSSGDLRALMPTYNMMLINTAYEEHLVTPVTSHATESRFTIQVFGMKSSTPFMTWEDKMNLRPDERS